MVSDLEGLMGKHAARAWYWHWGSLDAEMFAEWIGMNWMGLMMWRGWKGSSSRGHVGYIGGGYISDGYMDDGYIGGGYISDGYMDGG
jgi:hypothetical protein